MHTALHVNKKLWTYFYDFRSVIFAYASLHLSCSVCRFLSRTARTDQIWSELSIGVRHLLYCSFRSFQYFHAFDFFFNDNKIIQRNGMDVILLDYVLPGMTGLFFTIRQNLHPIEFQVAVLNSFDIEKLLQLTNGKCWPQLWDLFSLTVPCNALIYCLLIQCNISSISDHVWFFLQTGENRSLYQSNLL